MFQRELTRDMALASRHDIAEHMTVDPATGKLLTRAMLYDEYARVLGIIA